TPFNNNGYTRGGTYGAGGGGGSSGYSGGGGSYGMGGQSSRSADGYQAGGTYGAGSTPRKIASAGNPVGAGFPKPAPDVVRRAGGSSDGSAAPAPAMGLSDTIASLESELFGKSFHGETIPNRLNRLETTVFPNQKPANDMSMPDRVRRLSDAVLPN